MSTAGRTPAVTYTLAVGEVHGDFEADPQVFIGWLGPHNPYLVSIVSE